jgi:hypothetical protein
MLMRLLLILIYPLMIVVRLSNAVLRRDPLRLREPKDASLWIARSGDPERADYFSLDSRFEGAGQGRGGRAVAAVLLRVARWRAPSRTPLGRARRDDNIPDEVYTLW